MWKSSAALALVAMVSGCSVKTCSEIRQQACPSGGCFQHMNYHYDYTEICAEPTIDGKCYMPSAGSAQTHAQAEAICSSKGARLCSMTELLYNVAKGTGCDVENNRVWTLTTCEGGYVSMAGAFVESREDGKGLECTSESTLAGVVCCSTDSTEELCVEESAEECSSTDGSHSCCDDLKYTYNPVPCKVMEDCMTCMVPAEGRSDCDIEPYRYMKKVDKETSSTGFVCCNMEDSFAQCENGYCKHAPCKGSSLEGDGEEDPESIEDGDWLYAFTSKEWSNVRGDEWSRMACYACHGNGCDQCQDGYFKYDHHSECITCDAMDNCMFCQDYNACAQCEDDMGGATIMTTCPPLPGLTSTSKCCESKEPTMCSTTITKTPGETPAPSSPSSTPTPSTSTDDTPSPSTSTDNTPSPSTSNGKTPVPIEVSESVAPYSTAAPDEECPPDVCTTKTCGELRAEHCIEGGCFEYMNWHYEYTDICVETAVGEGRSCLMPSQGTGKTYAEAEATCSALGARLCTMTELKYNVAKEAGCEVESNRLWTLTTCEGGHVSQGGTFEATREEGMAAGCTDDSTLAGVVCCSTDNEDEVCVVEDASTCSATDGTHSCCDDRKYTYNPVPCKEDIDCQACIDPPTDAWGNRECQGTIYYKKVTMPGSKYGVMCCNSEPAQVYCVEGYCTLAPCSGGLEEIVVTSAPATPVPTTPVPGSVTFAPYTTPAPPVCATTYAYGEECAANPECCEEGYSCLAKSETYGICLSDADKCDGTGAFEGWLCTPMGGSETQTCTETLASGDACAENPTCCAKGTSCYAQTETYGVCMASCNKYSSATEGWLCTVMDENTCSEVLAYGDECQSKPSCCDNGLACFAENESFGRCLDTCERTGALEGWLCTIMTSSSSAANKAAVKKRSAAALGVVSSSTCSTTFEYGTECQDEPACCGEGNACFAQSESVGICLEKCDRTGATEGFLCTIMATQTPAPPTPAPEEYYNAMMHPIWENVRGDEWSRAHCKDCHGNGCDVCESGYFKYHQHAECISCDVIEGCNHCELQGCTWCQDLPQTICKPLPGLELDSWCCETGNPTMCQGTITKKGRWSGNGCGTPTPGSTKSPSKAVRTPSPPATPVPVPSGCTSALMYGDDCSSEPGCCAEGHTCYVQKKAVAYCLKDGECTGTGAFEGWTCATRTGTPSATATPTPTTAKPSTPTPTTATTKPSTPTPTTATPTPTTATPKPATPTPTTATPKPATPTPTTATCSSKIGQWASCLYAPTCCTEGFTCYEMNKYYAQCRDSCTGLGSLWTCRDLTNTPVPTPAPTASCVSTLALGDECAAAPSCCASGLSCYAQTSTFGRCLSSCSGSSVEGWLCNVMTGVTTPAPPACRATLGAWTSCAAAPTCCTSGYTCYQMDAFFSQCRKTCETTELKGWTCKVMG